MSTNIVKHSIEIGRKKMVTVAIIAGVGLLILFGWRIMNDSSQALIIGIALVIVALIVVPVLGGIGARRKSQSKALTSRLQPGALHFPFPALTSSKTRIVTAAAIIEKPVSGKGLKYAPSISVEADGIRGWYGGSKLHEAFFFPRENITEVAPFFENEGVRTFPAIAVGMRAPWRAEYGVEPTDRGEDVVPIITVGSVPGDRFAGLDGYGRAEAIAREAARILGVEYLQPKELVARSLAAENQ